jgi:oxygen-independent coproporphyrinogen-3 oxidase
VETVYVGGGTPTALPPGKLISLVQELAGLQRVNSLAVPPEFTLEANPGTLDVFLLGQLRRAGVTRLSLGVQSFSPRLRRHLGRRVSQAELHGCLAAIRAAGWKEWNIDLIHGIPGGTEEEARADIDQAVAAQPTHISLYDLTYTGSYGEWVQSRLGPGALAEAQKRAEEWYGDICRRLVDAGYRRYEISNFALPGHECRHNLAYWEGRDYLGLGASAVSTVGLERRTNPRSVDAYIAGEPANVENLSHAVRLWEQAMLGLRTAAGVSESAVAPVLDQAAKERLLLQGCVEISCGKLRLNPGFMDVSNSVVSALLRDPWAVTHTQADYGTH